MRPIMVIGTSSGVGKSWLCTGLCALLRRRGHSVAPFKAQNLSNNAAPVRLDDGSWGEIGRAQATQAEAAGLEPTVDMNPLLLKPMAGGTDVVVLGRSLGREDWGTDPARFEDRWRLVQQAYARLAAVHDVVVIEGAGSPVEMNLRARDLVNMRVAMHTGARTLLVGDIDRGGVFASLVGTVQLLPPDERRSLCGLVVNRFHGDPSGFHEGRELLQELTGVPVVGVLPSSPQIHIDDEDAAVLVDGERALLDVAVLALPTVANFTDVQHLGSEPDVGIRYVRTAEELGNPDLVVLPGARDTLLALRFLRETGLDKALLAAAARSIPLLGLCGGYQLLGERLDGVQGLGLLPVHTAFREVKEVGRRAGRTTGAWLLPKGLELEGYEIHLGHTSGAEPLVRLDSDVVDGAVRGLVAGTYLHGLLDPPPVRRALVNALRMRRGLAPGEVVEQGSARAWRQGHYERLADLLEGHLDLSWLDAG